MVKLRLFGFSFLILFLELSLIRFISGNLRIFGYFNNIVLIASFLGIGFGFLISKVKKNFIHLFPVSILFLVLVIINSKISIISTSGETLAFKYFSDGNLRVESPVSLVLIFILVVAVFTLLGQQAGKLFSKFNPLSAYSIDIAGSISAILSFSLVSYLSVPAFYWFLVSFIIYIFLIWDKKAIVLILVAILVISGILLKRNDNADTIWSPYYKINIQNGLYGENEGIIVVVNNLFHQFISSSVNREEFYYYPYTLFDNADYKNILIIGAGNGVDAAIALKKIPNVESIDAIEIDPEIVELGKKYNPDKPYDDPRVNVIIEDGRGYLERIDKKYDLVIYAETDSIILTNNSYGVRLESFLYTKDAFQKVKEHLSDNGVFFLFNYYRDDWVIQKLAGMTEEVFGQPPYLITTGEAIKSSTILNGPRLKEIDGSDPNLEKYESKGSNELATDNWPFLYLRQKSISFYYLSTLFFLMGFTYLFFVLIRRSGSLKGIDMTFAYFGVGFMLLETKSLINFAQLFGTTWIVNSMVIVAILSFILLANYINSKFKIKRIKLLYVLLFLILVFQMITPVSVFSSLGLVARYALASLFYLTPIFIANLIFAFRFKQTKNPSLNFGINILGGALGGFLEYSAMVVGYQALIVVIILSYCLTLRTIDR